MKKFKLLGFLAIAICLFWSYDVYADTAPCDEKYSNPLEIVSSIKMHDESKTEYSVGDKVYVDIKGTERVSGTNISILLKPTINPNSGRITAYLKNVEGKDSDVGKAYFIIPDEAVVGEKYEIATYRYYVTTDEIIDYGYTVPDGNKVPIYKIMCANYVTTQETATDDFVYLEGSGATFTIVEKKEELKDVLKSVSLKDKTNYFGGTITYNVTTTEPVSRIMLEFYNSVSPDGHNYGRFYSYMFYNSDATSYTAEVDAPTYGVNYVYPGDYKLNTIFIYDNDNNLIKYTTNKNFADSQEDYLYFESDLSMTLHEAVSNLIGEGGFEVRDFVLESNSAAVGEKLPLRYDFSFDTASRELKSVLLTFYDKDNNNMFSGYVKSILHDSYIIIPSIAKEGNYVLKSAVVTLESYQGGTTQIILNADVYNQYFQQTVTITKGNTDKSDTSVLFFSIDELDGEIYNVIKESQDGSIITIHADNTGVIPAEVFNSIKESTKQLIIEVNGNEWIFNGTDIEEVRPLNVSMDISDLDTANVPASIRGKFGEDGLAIGFPNNGKLPGKALVRLKSENVFNRLNNAKIDKYYIYYLDDNGNRLNRVASEVQKSYNGYIEFYINHNSTYIISGTEIKDKEILGEDEEILKVNSPYATAVKYDTDSSDNTMIYIIAGACGVLVIGIIALLITSKKKVKKIEETEKQIEEAKPTEEKVEEPKVETPVVETPAETPVVETPTEETKPAEETQTDNTNE